MLQEISPQFDSALIEHLEKIGQVVLFDEDDMLMRPGQYFKNSLLVLDGRIKLYRERETMCACLLMISMIARRKRLVFQRNVVDDAQVMCNIFCPSIDFILEYGNFPDGAYK